jgi:hypothetical protein
VSPALRNDPFAQALLLALIHGNDPQRHDLSFLPFDGACILNERKYDPEHHARRKRNYPDEEPA